MHKTDGQSNTSTKKRPPRNFRFSSGDAFIVGAIVLCCAIIIGGLFIHRHIHKDDARYVRITQDGKVLLEMDLREFSEPMEYRIDSDRGHMIIYLSSEKVYIKESSCADKICEKEGELTSPGDGAVCLPNRVVVQIVSGNSDEGNPSGKVDAVAK
ncbi:MAG: NusG domain II-containing protein [Clostridiales bacterium]|nr:NusG domain II-containing protein [Clostridiales bacterium]